MSGKIKLSISPAVAAYVRSGTLNDVKLAGCEASDSMETFDRITLLFCLSKDADELVRMSAIARIEKLSEDVINYYTLSEKANPLVLDTVMKMRNACANIHPSNNNVPLAFIPVGSQQADREESTLLLDSEYPDSSGEESEIRDEEPVDEEGEQFFSKYKISQMMGIGEKIKMALTGDKEWRSILVKDSNKLVSGSVIKNPRITESEVLKLIKSGIQNDEIMRLICSNKEWIKSYQIRKSLIENNRTPVQSSMRYLATMGEKDLASFAKSKNISTVVSTMAKRLLLSKKK